MLICFCIFKSKILFLLEILSFGFDLVNSECGAYLAVNQSLVYGSYPKMFLLFFNLILSLIPVLKPFFSIHILVSFCFLLLDPLEFCQQLSLAWKPYLSIFNSQWNEFYSKPMDKIIWTCLYKLSLIFVITIFAHIILFCFYPWPYILNVSLFSSNVLDIFSITVHVFRNLFWKICRLFGQILITCLKCSRAPFSLSSYNEQMRCGRGCRWLTCFGKNAYYFNFIDWSVKKIFWCFLTDLILHITKRVK